MSRKVQVIKIVDPDGLNGVRYVSPEKFAEIVNRTEEPPEVMEIDGKPLNENGKFRRTGSLMDILEKLFG